MTKNQSRTIKLVSILQLYIGTYFISSGLLEAFLLTGRFTIIGKIILGTLLIVGGIHLWESLLKRWRMALGLACILVSLDYIALSYVEQILGYPRDPERISSYQKSGGILLVVGFILIIIHVYSNTKKKY